jgi:hypothetical protein
MKLLVKPFFFWGKTSSKRKSSFTNSSFNFLLAPCSLAELAGLKNKIDKAGVLAR